VKLTGSVSKFSLRRTKSKRTSSSTTSLWTPDQSTLDLCQLDKGDRNWSVNAETAGASAKCPACAVESRARHSSYLRRLKDLPIQGRAVQLTVRVGRWRCRNTACKRRVFCQRLSNDVAQKHARETKRFRDAVQRIAYALGGRPGERLSQCLGLPINKDTLLERVKQLAQSRSQAGRIPAIGVDEWAWRKGYGGYGTILVDLEQGVVADLLPNRSAASFAKWLKEHPGVEVISRDRDGVYAEGGYDGAPRAKQVADRFHLVQSLIRAMQDEFAHQRKHLLIPAAELRGTIVHTRRPESCLRSAADSSGAARGSALDKRKSGSNGVNRKWPCSKW
jgi:transposase